jgi:hypothetical protein
MSKNQDNVNHPIKQSPPAPAPNRGDPESSSSRAIRAKGGPDERDWAKCSTLAFILDLSEDTIGRKTIPEDDDTGYVPYKLRYKDTVLLEGAKPRSCYYIPDGFALLRNPPKRSRGIQFQPAFRRPQGEEAGRHRNKAA